MDIIKLFAGGFPMTTETLEFLQNSYAKPIEALTNLTGDGVILEGIIDTAGTLSAGYLIKDKEIIPFVSSATGATIYIQEHTTQVPYNVDVDNDGNLDRKDAYVTRYATTTAVVAGDTVISSFAFSSLTRLAETRQPIGSGILWFDPLNIPKFYRVMDGTGGTVNGAPAIDLRDRFIKMAGSENVAGTSGGSRTKTLAVANLPSHTHTTPAISLGKTFGTKGARSDGGNDYLATNDADGSGSLKSFSAPAGTTGGGSGTGTAFNIEPSFYSAIWIQYIGF
jgi:microcystin-dependent protein